jgi:hypothetical protein
MNFADFVRFARVEQDTLSRRSFAGVNMGADAYIAISIYGCGAGHGQVCSDWIRI